MRTLKGLLVAGVTALALVGCGGGGGDETVLTTPIKVGPVETVLTTPIKVGGDETVSTTPIDYQLRTAYVNYVTSTGSSNFTVTGTYTSGGSSFPITGSGTSTFGNLTATTFEGKPAQIKAGTVTGNISINGINQSLNSTEYTYVDSNYALLGNSGTEYIVVTSANQVPITARLNDTNNFYNANRFTTSQKTTQLGTRTVSFVIEPYAAPNAYLTLILTDKDNSGKITATSSVKFIITPAGALTIVNETGVIYSTNPTAVTSLIINY